MLHDPATAIIASLLVGIGGLAWQMFRAQREYADRLQRSISDLGTQIAVLAQKVDAFEKACSVCRGGFDDRIKRLEDHRGR